MKSSSRIAINTSVTYLRSILGFGFALFSSRWILQALGATDFGLFNVVGSLIIFLTFFNSVMASSAARHFAFAIGKGDSDDVNRWFNTSLNIHLVLPAILILIGWPIAEYAIRNWLTIPPERVDICVIVFRISLIGAFVNMASIPFVAMFTAKQRIAEVSMWGMLQTFMVFSLAWILIKVTFDRLLAYAAGMVGIHVIIYSIKIARALTLFPDCSIRIQTGFDISRMKELLHFAGWSMFGGASLTLKNQGSAILLNLYHGPALNAAYGIARQVSTQANQLSLAMQTSFAPEITAREGRGEYTRVMALSHFSSKIGCIFIMLFSIPLILEMDYILGVWLRTPPIHTAIFCRLILLMFIIDTLTAGYMMAVNARGKIAAYQATVGGLLLLGLPLAWLFFCLGLPPASLPVAFIISSALATFARVTWLRRLFGEPIRQWLTKVLAPCVAIGSIATLGGGSIVLTQDESFIRFVFSAGLSLSLTLATCWFLALSKSERLFVIKLLKAALRRLNLKTKKETGSSIVAN